MTSFQTLWPRRRSLLAILALVLLCSLFAPLGAALASPSAPSASLNVPASGFIGEALNFDVIFDNTDTTDPGYGPYVDVILPAAGADGAAAATDDGITFTGANYLGTALTPVIPPFICTGGTFLHPLTGLATTCVNDTQIVILQLPFGSFTATQPPATINVGAMLSNLADVGTPLAIRARAGFAYGNDPLLNPATDPPIIQAAPVSAAYTPQLFKLIKTYLGPEDEISTGPNYTRQYRIDVDIATGQTLTNVDVSDILPNSLQFVGVVGTFVNGAPVATTAITTPSTLVPGGTLTRRFASVTGGAGAQDASVIFTFYTPRLDSTGAIIISPTTGDDVISLNNASTGGSWTPLDSRDVPSVPTINPAGPEHTLIDKSIAIQKTVANLTDAKNTPGDVLEYTLEVQISDFFALDGVLVDDLFSDGQHFDPNFTPLLQVNGNTYTLASAGFNPANFTVTPNYTPTSALPNDGTTAVQFRISNEIVTRGQNGRMIGGCVAAGGSGLIVACDSGASTGDGPTTARITFRTIIQDEYTDTYPSGDKSVDEGDLLRNDVTLFGNVLNNIGLTPTGFDETDDSHANIVIARGDIAKTIYAVNGLICAVQPCTNATIQPGDTVTYRVQRELPASDIEGLSLVDYLPLPIFDVDDTTAPIKTGLSAFDATVSAALPPAGTAKFGPADTFYARSGIVPFTTPASANDSTANSITFAYGTFDSSANPSTMIDLLFTVTANSSPFDDGLLLTNQLHELEASTNNGTYVRDAIVQVKIFEPVVNLRKGVIAAYTSTASNTATGVISGTPLPAGVTVNAPGTCARTSGLVHSNNLGTTFNSDVTAVDAGARVTFAIVLENTGTSQLGLFDARVRDVLPVGFSYVPASLCVTDGTGAAMTYTAIGSGLFDPTGGIELTDPGPTVTPVGALDPGKNLDGTTRTDGRNIAIITFDATPDSTVAPSQVYVNNATLYNYSSLEGGTDHTPIDRTDTASVTILPPALTKTAISSSEAHTTAPKVAIGEIIRYRLAVQLPEGTSAPLALLDRLPTGLTFVNDSTAKIAFVTNSGGITSTTITALLPGCANLTIAGNSAAFTPTCPLPDAAVSRSATVNNDAYATGDDVYFKLGNVVNSDADADAEYLVVEFNALVDNTVVGSNDINGTRPNTFEFRVNNIRVGPISNSVTETIAEPVISVAKSVSPATGDAGDTVTYSVTFSNASGPNNTSAFDVVLTDTLPVQLTNLTLVSTASTGTVTGLTSSVSGNALTVNADSMATGATVTVTYSATLAATVTSGQSINNTALVTYTSLPGTNGTIGNPTGTDNTGLPGTNTGERTGSGTAPNDLRASDTKTVTVFVPNPQKSLVATSESHVISGTVVIGEIARFRLVTRIAEGNSPNFQFRDNLPLGLRFLNDNTTKLALISTNPGLSSSTLSGGGPQVIGASTAGVTPTFVLPVGAISGGLGTAGAFLSGDDPLFTLGNLTNADNDGDAEFVVLEFNALVENIPANQNTVPLANTFTVRVAAADLATSNSVAVTIAEPTLVIAKQVLSTNGSTVTYQVVATNTGSVSAFDAIISDTLPLALDLNVGSITITPAGGATSGVANHSDPLNRVEFDSLTVPAAGSVTITYQATVVAGGATIANTATTNYTSLPGANGTLVNPTGSSTPGASSTSTGERDASGGINDYSAAAGTSLGSVGDKIWYDVDADGVLDAGEVGIPGVGVSVRWFGPDGIENTSDDSVITTTTDSSGSYLVSGLPLGAGAANYRVTVNPATLPNGLTSATYDLDNGTTGPNGNTLLTLTSGNANPRNADFGYTGSASLGDRIWLDSDSNGTLNGSEEGIGGVTVNLLWAGADGTLGNADDLSFSTISAPDGSYSFARLPAGAYRVDIATGSLPSGINPTYDLDGIGTPSTVTTSLADGQNRIDADFGYVGTGSLGNYIWLDVDGDGVQDAAEQGIGNVAVTLTWAGPDGVFGNGDDIAFATTTDGNGAYSFNGLPAGSYSVAVTPPTGMSPTYDLDGIATPSITAITLSAGQNRTDANFGYRGSGSIGDRVWFDRNGDNVQDAGEPGLAGVDVALTWAGPDGVFGGADDVLFSTTTDATGAYDFIGLPPGKYRVDVDQADAPSGTILTTANDPLALTLGAGEDYNTADFGFTGTGSLGDFVWLDRDGDGVQDAGEPGIGGATVDLIWAGPDGDLATAGDNISFTTSTSATGAYSFTNLPAGAFRVTVATATLPAGLTPSFDPDLTANSTTDTSLTSGQNRDDVDFGYQGSGAIGDRVWFDSDGDGAYDAGEPGLAGVDVTLVWAGPDGVFGGADDATFTTTTNASGGYNFAGLPAGEYRVDVDQADAPAGTAITTANDPTPLTLALGEQRTDIDFGFSGSGSLGNFIWLDRNGDGVQDVGEPGLPGVAVTVIWAGPDGDLATAGDNVSYSTTTDAAGAYSVTKLPTGPYSVTVSGLPGGVNQTFDPDGVLDNTSITSLTLGQNRDDMDFGYHGSGSIGDRVWSDVDGDKLQDAGEPGLVGVTINLTWYGLNGVAGGGDDLIFTTTTGANGAYNFSDLPAGNYSVNVDQTTVPSGTTLTTANDPLAVTLAAGETYTSADFGFLGATSLGDVVWLDLNGNGAQDVGEPGIGGVAVTLTWAGPDGNLATTADNATYTTTTDGAGAYTFIGVPPGNYRVDLDAATLPGGVTPTYDLDGTGSASNVTTTLTVGQDRTDVDFGYQGAGSIGDFVWFDRDGDGVQDAGEPGLANVTINLIWAGPDGVFGTPDDATLTQATNASGGYNFTGLPAGEYRADVDQATAPSGTHLTTANDPLSITLAAGQTVTNADFGFIGSGALGDRLWLDLDGDGAQDTNEPGLAGITVNLTSAGVDGLFGTADDLLSTQITGPDGSYNFSGLLAGSYRVDVDGATLPGGLTGTKERDATINGSTDVTLNAGDVVTDADFGYVGAGSLGDRVWFDKNGDGVQDAGEPGMAGVTITATWYGFDGTLGGGDDLIFSTTTDANGGYSFSGLPLGNYSVAVGAGVWSGTHETAELDGTLDGSTTASLTAAAPVRSDIDFGYSGTGAISQTVWRDADRDGIQGPGEGGISGVAITLAWAGPDGIFGTPDDVTYTTTTDANGTYQFPNLPAGSYTVRVDPSTLPPAITASYDKDGGDDSLTTVALGAGQGIADVNFGYGPVPTAIALASFTATWQEQAVELRWETTAEINTFGFSLYRSATGQRADAVRVTPDLILGQGRGQGGAAYSWSDTSVQSGESYTYWLVETEVNGTINQYGPARALPHTEAGANRVLLPLMLR